MRVLAVLSCLVAAALAEDVYTDKFDSIDLPEILANRRLLIPYVNCVLEKGRCNAEGKELKDRLQDALQTGCEKCTKKQEDGAYKVIEHLVKNEPEIWKELSAKFDPDNVFRNKYEKRALEKGIVLPVDV